MVTVRGRGRLRFRVRFRFWVILGLVLGLGGVWFRLDFGQEVGLGWSLG